MDVACQLCFGHDFPELHLLLAFLPLQLHPTLAPDHLVNISKLFDQSISRTTTVGDIEMLRLFLSLLIPVLALIYSDQE